MTGAEAAVKTLKAHGLSLVFGIPGVQNLEYFDAFVSEGFQVVQVSHELGASFMADAVGRITGEPGVVAVVPGPGLTNIFTGLGEALLDSAPLLALVPGVRSNFKESFQLHEIDQAGAGRALTKGYFQVERADAIADTVARAIQRARSGEPGPVVVEVPYNVLMESTRQGPVGPLPLEFPIPSEADLDRATQLILASKAPALHVGMGAAGAAAEVRELAERLEVPVSTTISGRGVLPEDHDLSVGFGFGPAGTALAEKIFKGRDLVLAVGCKFSEVGSGAYSLPMPRLIHLDANPAVLGKNFAAQIQLAGDAKPVLQSLLDRIRPARPLRDSSDLRSLIRAAHEKQKQKFQKLEPWPQTVNPARLLFELRQRAERDAILVTDSGAHTFWVVFSYDAYLPKSVLSPIDYSAMGYAIPGAIGAALAAPGRRVIAAVGDGAILMTGTELATAKRLGLPLVVIVFNDRALGIIKDTQERLYRRTVAVDLGGTDFAHFAAAFGCEYLRIGSDRETGAVLDQALAMKRLVLVDANVEYRGLTRHAWGTSRALAKRTPPSVLLRLAGRLGWRILFNRE
jgi:acetolactate synthase-1/2/3 large subunit